MVEKHSKLTQIREHNGSVPLKVAADYVTDRQEEMVKYLLSVTRDEEPSPFSGPCGASLLCSLIDSNFYDIALCVVQRYPKLVIEQSKNTQVTALDMIAGRPFAFLSGCKLTLWERWIYSVIAVDLLPYPARKHMEGDVENPRVLEDSSANKGVIITRFRTLYCAFQNSFSRGLINSQLTS
ncbi:hypothetical protein MKX01_035379 [Papaver californicum]|nr:hypothetical protein MKX01_035379 [Papaver californicum]